MPGLAFYWHLFERFDKSGERIRDRENILYRRNIRFLLVIPK
jgi:hypothetical protein